MRFRLALLVAVFGLTSQLAHAQARESVATESRDAATAFIGTLQFTVGRIGRDCLVLLQRAETPQEYVKAWLQRNGRYTTAASIYLEARLNEAESKGEGAKNALMRDLASIRNASEENINSLYAKSGKEAACKRMIGLIDSGAYDITSSAPIFGELEALLAWAQRQ